MRLAGPRRQDASFDLTPMIDVVLLLIIFFMLSSRFADTTLTQYDLPTEEGEATDSTAWRLVIELDRDGRMLVGGRPLALDEVASMVRDLPALAEDGASSGIVIHADRSCSARHLNRLAATLTSSGVRDWGLTTRPDGARSEGALP